MEQKEQIASAYCGTYATPKKLNRSNKPISPEIVDQLEDGSFTLEMVNELAAQFPVFRYKTCLTVHGNWPEISRTRIGGYQNVRQNANGSVEILWSAIDRDKVKLVEKYIRAAQSYETPGDGWNLKVNSTSRAFEASKRVTPDNLQECKNWAIETVNRISTLNVFGKVFAQVFNVWGLHYVTVTFHLYALPAESEPETALCILGMSENTYHSQVDTVNQYEARLTEKRKAEDAERAARIKEQAEKNHELLLPFRAQVEHLAPCKDVTKGVLVRACISDTGPTFKWTKIIENGTFGRVQIGVAFTPDLSLPAEWKQDGKQVKANEFSRRLKDGTRLFAPVEKPRETAKAPTKSAPEAKGGPLCIVDYSDKAIAVFGDTRPLASTFKAIGGRFNPFLKQNGICTPGWIFQASKRAEIEKAI